MSGFWGGVLGAATAGVLWAAVGVVFSRAARRGVPFTAFMAAAFSLSTAAALLLFTRHTVWMRGQVAHALPLAGIVAGGGLVSALGVIAMQQAMRRGHHGSTWTIGQSGLAVPFLAGVLIWRDHAGLANAAGAAAILTGLFLLGHARQAREPHTAAGGGGWLALALAAFLAIGIAQTLTGIPSRWQGWQDTARLRLPLLLAGSLLGYTLGAGIQGYPVRKAYSREAVLLAAIGIVSQFIMLRTLDVFASFHRVGLAYPIAVGTCIVGFGLYSILVLREHLGATRLAGLVLAAAGVVLVALR